MRPLISICLILLGAAALWGTFAQICPLAMFASYSEASELTLLFCALDIAESQTVPTTKTYSVMVRYSGRYD